VGVAAALSPSASAAAGPHAGACYDAALMPHSMWADGTKPVPCTETHRAETYHVGTVDAPAGAAQVQPATQQMFDLYAACEAKAKEFLGADWHTGRVELLVTLPRPADWMAGVRTYSCEVAETDNVGERTAVRRTSSLGGALAQPGPLTMRCFDMRTPPHWIPMVPISCDQPHSAEYAGAFTAKQPAAGDEDTVVQVGFDRCEPVVDAYLGSSNNRYIAWGFFGWHRYFWDLGQLTVRCFAIADGGKRFKSSVKGIGNRSPAVV
jgi:hypothetical protein